MASPGPDYTGVERCFEDGVSLSLPAHRLSALFLISILWPLSRILPAVWY